MSAKQAIISKCVSDCCCGERAEAKRCHIKTCPLWAISRGYFKVEVDESEVIETPKKKSGRGIKELSPEHKAKLLEGRRKALEAKNANKEN